MSDKTPSDTTISCCQSCGQQMHPTDWKERILSELTLSQARVGELEKDAARYRYMCQTDSISFLMHNSTGEIIPKEEVDRLIDLEMKAALKEKA